MDLEETAARNGCAGGEDQQQFNLPTDRPTGSSFVRNVGELHLTTRYHIPEDSALHKLPFIAQWPTVP
jgi:hypothetical protein